MRTAAALVALVAMTTQSMAATSLCVETHSSGYNWVDKAWVPIIFTTDSYIIIEYGPTEEIAAGCHRRISANGYLLEPVKDGTWQTTAGCFAAYIVGDEPTEWDVQMCIEYWVDDVNSSVSCANEGTTRYEFERSGEFTLSRMYSTRMSRTDNEKRDSLVLSVGKCSVID